MCVIHFTKMNIAIMLKPYPFIHYLISTLSNKCLTIRFFLGSGLALDISHSGFE
jgi:hypothetical protein